MFVLPIGDSPNIPKIPWVTWSLMGLNILVFLLLWPLSFTPADPTNPALAEYLYTLATERGIQPAAVRAIDLVHYELGARPAEPSLRDSLASIFLHGGLLHLAGNMLFLWIFGDNVEHRMGCLPFLVAYLGTGLASVGGDMLIRWGSGIPSVGASGAISGVLGFYFAWFPHNRIRLWGFFFPFFLGAFELSARVALGKRLERLGEERRALAAYQRALADHPRDPDRAVAQPTHQRRRSSASLPRSTGLAM